MDWLNQALLNNYQETHYQVFITGFNLADEDGRRIRMEETKRITRWNDGCFVRSVLPTLDEVGAFLRRTGNKGIDIPNGECHMTAIESGYMQGFYLYSSSLPENFAFRHVDSFAEGREGKSVRWALACQNCRKADYSFGWVTFVQPGVGPGVGDPFEDVMPRVFV